MQDKTRATRSLAKSQESQKKYGLAIKNYEQASEISQERNYEIINTNDANRLRASASPAAQEEFVNSNIKILKKENKIEEVAQAYVQKAETSLLQNNKEVALESFNKALTYAKGKPEEIIKISNEIAKVYAADNEFDKAIDVKKNLLNEAEIKKDFPTQIKQLQSLAGLYFKKEKKNEGLDLLKKAYHLAIEKGNATEAKNSLLALIDFYKKEGNDKQSLALYKTFIQNFEQLIQTDTTLIDAKTFQVTEEKIKQLEKEKALKDALIAKKNSFNYFLLAALALLVGLFFWIIRSLMAIKTKNKEIALQSLRREMNPHFIFNSLNSVNQFISENKELEANKYLSSYSHLMRNTMENSNKDFVTLDNEIDQLTQYLELEHLRFADKFDFSITIDPEIDPEHTLIPNMILQPQLENAIWHGLRYLQQKGSLKLDVKKQNKTIVIAVEDNGIGLSKSQELKTTNQKTHISRGMSNTKERIGLLNELYKTKITLDFFEKKAPEMGTIVQICFPLIDKIK